MIVSYANKQNIEEIKVISQKRKKESNSKFLRKVKYDMSFKPELKQRTLI